MIINSEYSQWLSALKNNIRQCQIKAALNVNRELLSLYWQLGKEIVEKQELSSWGDGFIAQLSKDLSAEFPEMKGWSERNLRSIRNWYHTYSQYLVIRKQVVSKFDDDTQERGLAESNRLPMPALAVSGVTSFENIFFSIPWGHHIMIMQKCKDLSAAIFYISQTVENNWSRSTLEWQIESNLYFRQGKAVTNFSQTLPAPQSDLAQQLTKDPYIVDLMGVSQEMNEREIEAYLDKHISRYLLELGNGFSYCGHQVPIKTGDDSFYIDQLFYHVKLHCYVVVELKATKFKPEHIGQLNFYVSAVDSQFRTDIDNPTIGLLICKDKNDVVAEYTLRNITSPIGVSSMKIYNELMERYKSTLPTVEEIENSLQINDDDEV